MKLSEEIKEEVITFNDLQEEDFLEKEQRFVIRKLQEGLQALLIKIG